LGKINIGKEVLIKKEEEPMTDHQKILINPAGTEAIYESLKFSQAIRVGDQLWISGQVGIDDNFKVREGLELQTRQAFQNLAQVIEKAGGTFGDIVELVTYHKDISEMPVFAKVKSEFFSDNYPAWTALGVSDLVMPELLVEIRATAIIGCDKKKE